MRRDSRFSYLQFRLRLIDVPYPIEPFAQQLVEHTVCTRTKVEVQTLP